MTHFIDSENGKHILYQLLHNFKYGVFHLNKFFEIY